MKYQSALSLLNIFNISKIKCPFWWQTHFPSIWKNFETYCSWCTWPCSWSCRRGWRFLYSSTSTCCWCYRDWRWNCRPSSTWKWEGGAVDTHLGLEGVDGGAREFLHHVGSERGLMAFYLDNWIWIPVDQYKPTILAC